MKLTAVGVTFKCMTLMFRENWSDGSRGEWSGHTGVMEIKVTLCLPFWKRNISKV